jgi:hypothetical protein
LADVVRAMAAGEPEARGQVPPQILRDQLRKRLPSSG